MSLVEAGNPEGFARTHSWREPANSIHGKTALGLLETTSPVVRQPSLALRQG